MSGLKFDSEKPRMDLLDTEFLEEVARVLGFGASKYETHNWRKGHKISRLLAASLRHITTFNKGEDLDPESGYSHLAHAACCLMFMMYNLKYKPENDDRFKVEEV